MVVAAVETVAAEAVVSEAGVVGAALLVLALPPASEGPAGRTRTRNMLRTLRYSTLTRGACCHLLRSCA